MRLLKRDQQPIIFRERIPLKDHDGTTYEGWSPEGFTIQGNVQPAGGKVMAEQYGECLGYVLVMYTERSAKAIELLKAFNGERKGYGAWVYAPETAEEPDYKVVAVKGWRHIIIELERVRS